MKFSIFAHLNTSSVVNVLLISIRGTDIVNANLMKNEMDPPVLQYALLASIGQEMDASFALIMNFSS